MAAQKCRKVPSLDTLESKPSLVLLTRISNFQIGSQLCKADETADFEACFGEWGVCFVTHFHPSGVRWRGAS